LQQLLLLLHVQRFLVDACVGMLDCYTNHPEAVMLLLLLLLLGHLGSHQQLQHRSWH
jgi:hypothetical protein